MGGNPIWLVFLGLGLLIGVALVVLAVMQRRMYADQIRQVQELLREAREISEQERAGSADERDPEGDG